MRRPRACLAKHAPGRRRGSAWRPIGAARQELADGGRLLSRGFVSQAPETAARRGKPGEQDGQRKARPGAVRKTPQSVRKLVWVARRAAPRISERECGHIKNNGCAPWRAIPLVFAGREEGTKTGLPGASPNNTGDDACLFENWLNASWRLNLRFRHPANAGIQGWMPAGACPREGGDGHERML